MRNTTISSRQRLGASPRQRHETSPLRRPARLRKLLAEQLEQRRVLSTIFSFEGGADGFSAVETSGGDFSIVSTDSVLNVAAFDGGELLRLRSENAGAIQLERTFPTVIGDKFSIFGAFDRNGGAGSGDAVIARTVPDRADQRTLWHSDAVDTPWSADTDPDPLLEGEQTVTWSNDTVVILRLRQDSGSAADMRFGLDRLEWKAVPRSTTFTPAAVSEGEAAGALMGAFSTVDLNAGDAISYQLLTAGVPFQIIGNQLQTTAPLNFETNPQYSLTVRTLDSDGLFRDDTFTVGILNLPPSAPTDIQVSNNVVVEGAAIGTLVGVAVSSTDPAGGTVSYSLTNNAGGRFGINPATGVVTVANSSLINFETQTSHTITIVASDGALTSPAVNFTIGVLNANPSVLVDSNSAPNQAPEGAPSGTFTGITALSTDPNGPVVTYSLVDSAGGRFAIDSATGVVTVANGALLNFEAASSHSLMVRASTAGGSGGTSTQFFTIFVTNISPSAPGDAAPAVDQVPEGAANGTYTGITASASDPNGASLTYTLTNNAGGRFAIDPLTGVVTVAASALLNYESATSHTITVVASDGLLTSAPASFTVQLTNVAPTAAIDNDAAPNSVLEEAANGTAVGIVALATDPDGAPLTYSLTDSAGGRFAIDGTTGAVVVANGALLDHASASSYTISIAVSDGFASSAPSSFTIAILPVNDAPSGADRSVSLPEDGVYVLGVEDFGFSDPADSPPHSFLAVRITTLPALGSLVLNGAPVSPNQMVPAGSLIDGQLRFVPDPDDNGLPYTSFTFQLQDDGGTANGGIDLDPSPNVITITVRGVNAAPTAVDDTFSTYEDQSITGNVLVNDTGIGDAITVVAVNGNGAIVGQPVATPFGSVTVNANGAFSYTPGADSEAIDDSFTYTISDGYGRTSTATVTIGISHYTGISFHNGILRVAGSAGNDLIVLTVFGGIIFNNDDSTGISMQGVTEIHLWGRGGNDLITNLTGTPSIIYGGLGDDAILGGAARDLVFGGLGNDRITGGSGNDFLIGGDGRDRIVGSAGHDILMAGDVSSVFSEDELLAVLADWVATKEPDPGLTDEVLDETLSDVGDKLTGSSGSDWFIIGNGDRVTDFRRNDREADVITRVATAQTVTVQEDTAGSITFTASDAESNPLTDYTIVSGPANGTLSGTGANRTYTPNANFSGSDSFTFRIDDGSLSSTATVSITVNAVNDAPTLASIANLTIPQNSPQQTVTLTGISTGPANEAGQSITSFIATSSLTGLISNPTITYTAGSSTATLRFTPVAHANGQAAITVTLADNGGGNNAFSRTFTVTVTPAATTVTVSTPGLYDPTNSRFLLRNTNNAGPANTTFSYGAAKAGWLPVAGDWNGDGADTLGLYNPTTSTFLLKNSNLAGRADVVFAFGPANAGWLPIAGDWNGDGTDTVGLYNPTLGKFFLKNSHAAGAADVSFHYGAGNAGWLPIAGDWNGDGVDTVGVYNSTAGAVFLRNANSAGVADAAFFYGAAGKGWLPVAGDWNGDQIDSIGLYNPAASAFHLRNFHTPGPANISFSYGPASAGWRPVTGDWNGPSSGTNNTILAAPGSPADNQPALPADSRAAPGGPGNAESRVVKTMTERDQAIRGTDLITALFQADSSPNNPLSVANRLARGAHRLPSAAEVDQVHAELFDWAASRPFLN